MPKTEILNIDPRVVHQTIALKLRDLANLFDQLGDGTVAREITDNGITAAEIAKAKPKADKPKADKPKAKAAEPEEVEVPADMTPEQIAADLKAKLVALVGKDRAKAVSLLGTIGAKNFSGIPVEKHAEMLRKVDAALNPAAAKDDDDPLA